MQLPLDVAEIIMFSQRDYNILASAAFHEHEYEKEIEYKRINRWRKGEPSQ
jgi:hypothetical protein